MKRLSDGTCEERQSWRRSWLRHSCAQLAAGGTHLAFGGLNDRLKRLVDHDELGFAIVEKFNHLRWGKPNAASQMQPTSSGVDKNGWQPAATIAPDQAART